MPVAIPFSAAEIEKIGRASVTEAYFAELDFPDGIRRHHGGIGNRTVGGYDWVGMTSPWYPGVVASMSGIRKEVFGEAAAATLILSGAVDGYIASIHASRRDIEGRPASVYWCVFDAETQEPIIPLYPLIKKGTMSSPKWTRTGVETRLITLTIENELSSLNFSPGYRWSSAGHRSLYPGDGAMDFVGMKIVETLK